MTRHQLVANAMTAGGDWARAAEYEERAVRLEHQIELAREPRATESRA
jgi:hypothetical protein